MKTWKRKTTLPCLLLLLFALIILFPQEAFMGRVYHNELTLAELTEQSMFIVAAECLAVEPAHKFKGIEVVKKHLPSHPTASQLEDGTWLNYDKLVEKLKSGQTFTVRDAHTNLHKRIDEMAEKGVRKSWSEDTFMESGATLKTGKKYILFLSATEKRNLFEYEATGAHLDYKKLKEVKSHLSPKP